MQTATVELVDAKLAALGLPADTVPIADLMRTPRQDRRCPPSSRFMILIPSGKLTHSDLAALLKFNRGACSRRNLPDRYCLRRRLPICVGFLVVCCALAVLVYCCVAFNGYSKLQSRCEAFGTNSTRCEAERADYGSLCYLSAHACEPASQPLIIGISFAFAALLLYTVVLLFSLLYHRDGRLFALKPTETLDDARSDLAPAVLPFFMMVVCTAITQAPFVASRQFASFVSTGTHAV